MSVLKNILEAFQDEKIVNEHLIRDAHSSPFFIKSVLPHPAMYSSKDTSHPKDKFFLSSVPLPIDN